MAKVVKKSSINKITQLKNYSRKAIQSIYLYLEKYFIIFFTKVKWEVLIAAAALFLNIIQDRENNMEAQRIQKRDSLQLDILTRNFEQNLKKISIENSEFLRIRKRDSVQIALYVKEQNQKRVADSIHLELFREELNAQKIANKSYISANVTFANISIEDSTLVAQPVVHLVNTGISPVESVIIEFMYVTLKLKGYKSEELLSVYTSGPFDFSCGQNLIPTNAKVQCQSFYPSKFQYTSSDHLRFNHTSPPTAFNHYIIINIKYLDKYDRMFPNNLFLVKEVRSSFSPYRSKNEHGNLIISEVGDVNTFRLSKMAYKNTNFKFETLLSEVIRSRTKSGNVFRID
jgi:hypothetical protein